MKRIILTALLAALMLVPATALAKRGHKVHRHHGQVGTITSFDSATGELVITTTKGRTLSALVTDDTHLQCRNDEDESGDDSTASTSSHGDDDGDNHDAGDDHGGRHDDNDDNDDEGDDNGHHGHHSSKCTTDDLATGTVVRRARIDIDEDDDAVWTKLKLGASA